MTNNEQEQMKTLFKKRKTKKTFGVEEPATIYDILDDVHPRAWELPWSYHSATKITAGFRSLPIWNSVLAINTDGWYLLNRTYEDVVDEGERKTFKSEWVNDGDLYSLLKRAVSIYLTEPEPVEKEPSL